MPRLALHAVLRGLQTQHGLRRGEDEGDFECYRQYCARRLRRLRRNVELSNGKMKSILCRKVTATTPQRTAEHVFILALLADRAWAYAMELKVRASLESKPHVDSNERNRGMGRRHSRRRLTKAAAYGAMMRALCATMGDDMLARESDVYASWLEGLELESKDDHGRAAEILENTRATYLALAQECTLHEDIFQERAADCLTAAQRCTFAAGGRHASNTHSTLDDKQSVNDAVNTTTEIEPLVGRVVIRWCGMALEITAEKIQQHLRVCKLENEPSAVAVDKWSGGAAGLCSVGFKSAAVSVSVMLPPNEAIYATRLQQLEDMAHAARTECDYECHKDQFSEGKCNTKSQRSLELVAARATYEKLDLLFQHCDTTVAERATVWRRTALDASSAHIYGPALGPFDEPRIPDDVLHVYDNLIQVTNEMIALADIRDSKNEALAEVLDARAAVLQAYKCHFLAEMFSIRRVEALKAFSLFRHASYLADRACQEAKACEASQMSQEMVHLSDASRASASRLRAAHVINSKQIDTIQIRVPSTVLPFRLDRLDVYIVPGRTESLSAISPKPRSAQCKPILFNLAHNHLDLPSFHRKAGRGLFRWLRR